MLYVVVQGSSGCQLMLETHAMSVGAQTCHGSQRNGVDASLAIHLKLQKYLLLSVKLSFTCGPLCGQTGLNTHGWWVPIQC